MRLQELSCRLDDVETPDRRNHLGWMHEFISQNLLSSRRQIDERPTAYLKSNFAMLAFYQALMRVELVAGATADQHISADLLKRPRRMQSDRGLGHLVPRAAYGQKGKHLQNNARTSTLCSLRDERC
jgi:hypothetical protein